MKLQPSWAIAGPAVGLRFRHVHDSYISAMNRTVVITGASSGIGAATALALADRCRLALVARRIQELAAVAARVRAMGGSVIEVACDLRDPAAAMVAVNQTITAFGGLDAVINNAGQFAVAPAAEASDAHWDDVFALNLHAAVRMVRAARPHLRNSHGGWIVNVSSIVVEHSFSGCAAYTASKAALEAWSRILRDELRSEGIRVGVIAPGATDTPALRAVMPGAAADPSHRLCRAEDVAAAIRFMIEQPASASIDRISITPPAGPL